MLEVHLWADGSGTTEGNPGGWAFVLDAVHPTTGERRTIERSGASPNATNNRMEMTAVIRGLQAIKKPSVVVVHSDSRYVIDAMAFGRAKVWKAQGFHKRKNADLWEELLDAAEPHEASFQHVRGHTGVHFNEVCDRLAGEARRSLLLVD